VLARNAARRSLLAAVAEADALIARLPSELGLLAIECARKIGRPYLVELVGCPADALRYHGTLNGLLYAPFARIRVRSAVREAPYVIYVTKQYLQGKYPTRGRAAACSNVEVSIDNESVARRVAKVAAPRKPFTIGTIAPLGPRYKGLDVALKALASISLEHPSVEYRILGPGDPRPWYALADRLRVRDQVKFQGVLPAGGPVNAWLDELDLYVQPSLTEGLPRALLEALARACPALGSRAGGIPEVLPEGCLHEPGNVRELATGIHRAITDESWRQHAALNNFETARCYSSKLIQQQRAAILTELRAAAARRVQ